MSIQPLVPYPDEIEPGAPSVAAPEEVGRLLQLRTELGSFYVRPSRWQRLRLLWMFRNFHVLAFQVLTAGDQRLVEALALLAKVEPVGPIPEKAVLGVVEHARIRPTEAMVVDDQFSRMRVRQRGSLATAFCFGLIACSVLGFMWVQTRTHSNAGVVVQRAAVAGLVPAARPAVQTSPRATLPVVVAPVVAPLVTKPVMAVAPVVAPLVVKPVVAAHLPPGDVRLRAVISGDGSVKEMTVLSGNPRLAGNALRAARRWHDRQERVGDTETSILVSYFGPDAVSISALAN